MKSKKPKFTEFKDRKAVLEKRRNVKMAQSAHAYVRGNTHKFYEWLETKKGRSVPRGPAIWICGDCHMGNLGPVGDTKGHIDIQIRDFDQSVIGNPAHDLIRLGLSLASAARGSDLPGVTTARMLEHMIEGYSQAFSGPSHEGKDDTHKPESVKIAMKNALRRSWKHLAQERIEDTKPTIPLSKTFWPLSSQEKHEVKRLFAAKEVRALVTMLRSRDNDASIEVVDAAYWMKGCSSLGHLRIAVLVRVGNTSAKDEFCLMDIKEAVTAIAPHYPKHPMPRDNAMRVVTAAAQLSPHLGKRMLATQFLGHSVFLRELLPQDLKLGIDHLTCDEATNTARFLAGVVGKAHAHQMDKTMRKKWLTELDHNRTQTLDAPSWLWSSVVELVVSHEAAYLEHCRKYAMHIL